MSSRNAPRRKSDRAVSPARKMAFEVLRQVSRRRGEPATLLNDPRYRTLAQPDRDLATEITLGVLRHRGSLDWVLAHHVRRELSSLDDALVFALRIGLYQIRHLDRVPHRAAVDESVRLAHAFGPSRGAGLVNAVLRSVLREPATPSFPRKEDDPLAYLATTLSHPGWLARRYLARLGIEGAEARCRRQNEAPVVYARVSSRVDFEPARLTLAAEGVETETVPEVPRCLKVVGSRGSLSDTSLFRQGLVFVQDAGSQLIPTLLDLRAGDVVLDVCAAPGGKATAMGERVFEGRVVAVDKRIRRARLLKQLALRLGTDNVLPVVSDGARLPLRQHFSRILLDVPCSSLGTLRRNPDIKWRVTEDELKRLSTTQLALLEEASRLLKPDGRLVYSTCSTEPEENAEVIERFLSSRPGFRLVDARKSLPEAAHYLVTPAGTLETLPERDDMDGYFAAVLSRTESR